ncbi:YhgE/Pip family protein [Rathayibacter soli]|uniref:YhgE/Pip family protein n=1 Tax=Rathayibacter soli TaxID=3144168 RepID=UPI0027E3D8D1|nr:YhgE/Pip family protein [Glaciibacter superstes]
MKFLSFLLKAPDAPSRSRTMRTVAVVLALVTPLLVAGFAVTSVTQSQAGVNGTPNLPAAVVNLDKPIQITVDGKQVPVAAGKLLTSELRSSNSSGLHWTITDADAASAGLASGAYSAVVTIPADFSRQYSSSQGPAPTVATLDVQTDRAQGYVASVLAASLVTRIQAQLSQSLTRTYVAGTLSGFSELHTQLASVATNTQKLAAGADGLASGLRQAATGMTALDSGAQLLSTGMQQLAGSTPPIVQAADGLSSAAGVTAGAAQILSDGTNTIADSQRDARTQQVTLDAGIAQLQSDLPSLTPAEVAARLQALKSQSSDVVSKGASIGDSLAVATVGAGAVKVGAGLVSQGTSALASGMPVLSKAIAGAADGAVALASGTGPLSAGTAQLAAGAGTLATGAGALASGLGSAATAVPSYTAAEQKTLSTVVSAPVSMTVTDAAGAPGAASAAGTTGAADAAGTAGTGGAAGGANTAAGAGGGAAAAGAGAATALGAIAAVMVPVALWLGAFALYLVLSPFDPKALGSAASTWRVARQSLVPSVVLGCIQALIVVLGLGLLGVSPAHRAASALFVLVLSAAFVCVHHGVIALFGRAGRMLSLAFISLQVVAAGVLVPAAFSPSWLSAVSGVMPLTAAVQGMQALLMGQNVQAAIGTIVMLIAAAAIGVALTGIAVSRARLRAQQQ